jgi:hypothetical protein
VFSDWHLGQVNSDIIVSYGFGSCLWVFHSCTVATNSTDFAASFLEPFLCLFRK